MRFISLKNTADFERVFNNGVRIHGRRMTLIVSKSVTYYKVGFATSKKLGGAVTRNRVKRRLREAFRAILKKLKVPAEIVCLPKGAIREAHYNDIVSELAALASKAGLMQC